MATNIRNKGEKYKGLTFRQLKKENARTKGSTPGKEKGLNCKATPLDKAMAKYPRAHKSHTLSYIAFNLKKDKLLRRVSFFTTNFK